MAESFDLKLKRLLLAAGYSFVRSAKGSHEMWWSPRTQRNITVPNNIVSRHTANGVLKQADLPKAF